MTNKRAQNGELGRYFYEVALKYEGPDCLIWPYGLTKAGRPQIRLDGLQQRVHRAVCKVAKGNPPTNQHEAAHSCGNMGCVNPHHLSWKTRTENEADKRIHGTVPIGERNGQARLTPDLVREIRSLKGKVSRSNIASRFDIAKGTVNSIYSGQTWSWLS